MDRNASEIAEYRQACAPYDDLLNWAIADIGDGYEWGIVSLDSSSDPRPAYFCLIDSKGDRVCYVRPIGQYDPDGQFLILDARFRMLTSTSCVRSALHRANTLAMKGLARPNMGEIDPEHIRANLIRALDDMLIGAVDGGDPSTALLIVNIALAFIAERKHQANHHLLQLATQQIAEYSTLADRFRYANMSDDDPDFVSLQELSLDVSIASGKIVTLVMAHVNLAAGIL